MKNIFDTFTPDEINEYNRSLTIARPLFEKGPRWGQVVNLVIEEIMEKRIPKCLHPVEKVDFIRVGLAVGYNKCGACGRQVEVAGYKEIKSDS
jgi:hypothetical protein